MATYTCKCGRELLDMWNGAGSILMVECPEHGVRRWSWIEENVDPPEVAS